MYSLTAQVWQLGVWYWCLSSGTKGQIQSSRWSAWTGRGFIQTTREAISRAFRARLPGPVGTIVAKVSISWEPSTIDTDEHEQTIEDLATLSVSSRPRVSFI